MATTATPVQYPFSKSINHITSYPVVSDTLSYAQTFAIVQQAVTATQRATGLLQPFAPLLEKANNIAAPVVNKVDDFAESKLGQLDEKVPFVKKPTQELADFLSQQKDFATGLAQKEREYVLSVFADELEKAAGDNKTGYIPTAKAGVNTGIVISQELIAWITELVQKRRAESKTTTDSPAPTYAENPYEALDSEKKI
ncbi:hypothetical protein BJ508DRAFT_117507 [Ascobolus immersus RN42]|uniref:Uncharacterized protein n=1 Tax=Ascobolus immersus RN42 TaxID=1160509 RepID=A0A3N4I642_ASCIM|nr:hypothetical protein BJ508DRAFT_117507 [Ascobolus immersus RN42]